MILRRFVEALRRQDWLTVTLELLIVVIGIFIGLQADAWNESRKERALERAHLEQLHSDLGYNAQQLEDLAAHHSESADELKFAVTVIMRGRIDPAETERFKWALMTMKRYPPPEIRTGGYDTMIAAGDLSVLRDLELKTRLVELRAALDTMDERLVAFTGGLTREFSIPSVATAVPHPSGKGVYWRLNFDNVLDYPDSLGELATERRNHQLAHDMYADVAERCAELQAYIGELIGR